jgi:hypothetical protein
MDGSKEGSVAYALICVHCARLPASHVDCFGVGPFLKVNVAFHGPKHTVRRGVFYPFLFQPLQNNLTNVHFQIHSVTALTGKEILCYVPAVLVRYKICRFDKS